MSEAQEKAASPRVLVIADVESNAEALIDRVFRPAGIQASTSNTDGPPPDILVLDITVGSTMSSHPRHG
ncbi:MAG: hypothetical protein P8Z42_15670 [Anaerolineales bacterium]